MTRTKSSTRWEEYLPLTVVVLFGVLIATAAFLLLRAYSFSKEQEQFQRDSSYYAASFRGSIERHLNSLSAIRAFVTASHVTRWEFSTYAHQIMPQNPSIQGVLWAPLIQADQRAQYESDLQNDGLYGLKIHALTGAAGVPVEGERPNYLPITFAEPSESNLGIVGTDLNVVPEFGDLLKRAQVSQRVVASNQLRLPRAFGVSDATILLAYRLVGDDRRVLGYAIGFLNPAALVTEVAGHASPSIQAKFAAGTTAGSTKPDGQADEELRSWFAGASFHNLIPLTIGDKRFVLALRSTGHVDPLRTIYLPAGSALLVIALTGLLVQNMSSTLLQKRAVERAVVARTAELRDANRTLSLEVEQRRQAEASLSIARDKAEAASQAKSAFLATMSHELRTPLNSVIGFSNILASDTQLPATHQSYASEILDNGQRLLRLVNDILDLTQMLSADARLSHDLIYLDEIAQGVAQSLEDIAKSAAVTFQVVIKEPLPPIYGDNKRIRRAIVHMAENAIKFNRKGGSVNLRLYVKSERLIVEIEDTGVGISDAQKAKVCDAFAQNEAQLGRHYEGTGLGLAYVSRVAHLHSAVLAIRSKLGSGTVVGIAFPIVETVKALEVA